MQTIEFLTIAVPGNLELMSMNAMCNTIEFNGTYVRPVRRNGFGALYYARPTNEAENAILFDLYDEQIEITAFSVGRILL